MRSDVGNFVCDKTMNIGQGKQLMYTVLIRAINEKFCQAAREGRQMAKSIGIDLTGFG